MQFKKSHIKYWLYLEQEEPGLPDKIVHADSLVEKNRVLESKFYIISLVIWSAEQFGQELLSLIFRILTSVNQQQKNFRSFERQCIRSTKELQINLYPNKSLFCNILKFILTSAVIGSQKSYQMQTGIQSNPTQSSLLHFQITERFAAHLTGIYIVCLH